MRWFCHANVPLAISLRSPPPPRLRRASCFAVWDCANPAKRVARSGMVGEVGLRTYEGVSQRIYSPPPLPLGTLPRTSHAIGVTWETEHCRPKGEIPRPCLACRADAVSTAAKLAFSGAIGRENGACEGEQNVAKGVAIQGLIIARPRQINPIFSVSFKLILDPGGYGGALRRENRARRRQDKIVTGKASL